MVGERFEVKINKYFTNLLTTGKRTLAVATLLATSVSNPANIDNTIIATRGES